MPISCRMLRLLSRWTLAYTVRMQFLFLAEPASCATWRALDGDAQASCRAHYSDPWRRGKRQNVPICGLLINAKYSRPNQRNRPRLARVRSNRPRWSLPCPRVRRVALPGNRLLAGTALKSLEQGKKARKAPKSHASCSSARARAHGTHFTRLTVKKS